MEPMGGDEPDAGIGYKSFNLRLDVPDCCVEAVRLDADFDLLVPRHHYPALLTLCLLQGSHSPDC